MPSIPCPKCKTQITFNVKDILDGKAYNCMTCNIKITLSYKDNETALSQATKQLDKLKDELGIK
jgi:DNA-directed RNA polymerase subunit RPC12/RpoP|nr:hypothetical protein [uncultured Psychroserpens sp.]